MKFYTEVKVFKEKNPKKELEDKLIKLYRDTDLSVSQIADKLGISIRKLYMVLDENNIPRRNKKKRLSPLQLYSLINNYYNGASFHELSNQYNISINMVSDIVERYSR